MNKHIKKIYRYEIEYKNYDDDTRVMLREYPVIRETEETYFIKPTCLGYPPMYGATKRVSKTAINTYAYNTKEKAKEHFIRRTEKRVAWYKFWTKECRKGLELIKEGLLG